MHVILIPGLWLDGPTWAPVTADLTAAGHTVTELTLPGLESRDADRTGITLADHVAAVVAAVDEGHAEHGPVLLVGHSAGSAIAYCAVDARPDKVARVVYIGGFPSQDGEQLLGGLATEGADAPFPGWAEFEGPDSADLDEDAKAALLEVFRPSPSGVTMGTIRLSDERRFGVPATAVCPEYSADDLRQWIADGELPELARATALEVVDIDSGHWPQVTQPGRLAAILVAEAAR